MADLTRADELVQAIDGDAAFRSEVDAAPTAEAKREVLDAHGFQDVGLDEMRAYVESKGGTLKVPERGHELTDQELMSVAGGTSQGDTEAIAIGLGVGAGAVVVTAAAVAAV